MRNEDFGQSFRVVATIRQWVVVAKAASRVPARTAATNRRALTVLGAARAGAGLAGIRRELTVRQRPCSPPHGPRTS
jgi:hypothetical protein